MKFVGRFSLLSFHGSLTLYLPVTLLNSIVSWKCFCTSVASRSLHSSGILFISQTCRGQTTPQIGHQSVPKKFQYGGQNARKGFWSEFLRSPLRTSREKSRRVKTGYLEERNDRQIHVLKKTSFVLICKLPGLFLKRPFLKHAWSGERRQFTC